MTKSTCWEGRHAARRLRPLRSGRAGFSYASPSEVFDSDSQITGLVVTVQTLPGVYDVEVINPDEQAAVLEGALTIQ